MAAAIQRPLRGSRVSSFYPVKSLPALSSLDSAFQLQEYISLLIRLDMHDVDTIVSLPGKANPKEKEGEKSPEPQESDSPKTEEKEAERKSEIQVDRACWIYEQLRRLAQDLSYPLITTLQQECTRTSCPEMKAGEWLYLCVAHGNDGAMEQCCAIDYILHTLDSATALLNSPRAFPSRLSIQQSSYRHFSSLARRLGRIFAHAYFHHREAFEQAEAESSLYARFLKLTIEFDLVPNEFLVIPQRAIQPNGEARDDGVEPPRLLAAAISPPQDTGPDSHMATGASQISEVSSNQQRNSPGAVSLGNVVGTDSPRKMGRSRTDTMVLSEGFSAAEELAAYHSMNDTSDSESNSTQTNSILLNSETSSVPDLASQDATTQPTSTPHAVLEENPEIIDIPALEASDDSGTLSELTDRTSDLPSFEDVPLIALAEPTKTVEIEEPLIEPEPEPSENVTEPVPPYTSLPELPEISVPEIPAVQEPVAAQDPEISEVTEGTTTETLSADIETDEVEQKNETNIPMASAEPPPEHEQENEEEEELELQPEPQPGPEPEPEPEPEVNEESPVSIEEPALEELPQPEVTEQPVIVDISDNSVALIEVVDASTDTPPDEITPSAPAESEVSPVDSQEVSIKQEPAVVVVAEEHHDPPHSEVILPESEGDIADEKVESSDPEVITSEQQPLEAEEDKEKDEPTMLSPEVVPTS